MKQLLSVLLGLLRVNIAQASLQYYLANRKGHITEEMYDKYMDILRQETDKLDNFIK